MTVDKSTIFHFELAQGLHHVLKENIPEWIWELLGYDKQMDLTTALVKEVVMTINKVYTKDAYEKAEEVLP